MVYDLTNLPWISSGSPMRMVGRSLVADPPSTACMAGRRADREALYFWKSAATGCAGSRSSGSRDKLVGGFWGRAAATQPKTVIPGVRNSGIARRTRSSPAHPEPDRPRAYPDPDELRASRCRDESWRRRCYQTERGDIGPCRAGAAWDGGAVCVTRGLRGDLLG